MYSGHPYATLHIPAPAPNSASSIRRQPSFPLLLELLKKPQLQLLHHIHHSPSLLPVTHEPELLLNLTLELALYARREAVAQILLVVRGTTEPGRRIIVFCLRSRQVGCLTSLAWLIFVN